MEENNNDSGAQFPKRAVAISLMLLAIFTMVRPDTIITPLGLIVFAIYILTWKMQTFWQTDRRLLWEKLERSPGGRNRFPPYLSIKNNDFSTHVWNNLMLFIYF